MTDVLHLIDGGDPGTLARILTGSFPPGAAELWQPQEVPLMLAMTGCHVFTVRQGESPWAIGCALVRVIADEAELLTLAVLPNARRSGAGRLLLSACAAHARRMGARILFLEVRDTNHAALTLYKNAGFQHMGRRPDYYRDSNKMVSDALTWQLIL